MGVLVLKTYQSPDISLPEGIKLKTIAMALVYSMIPIFLLGMATGVTQDDDLIVDLPGLDYTVNFKQYSGYLNGTEGRHLHYWFTESQNDPSNDPLVLWLNGGPGCSSLSGLLTENGPFFVKEDGLGLYENPYSWNMVANVLFLESPACVGFSYDDDDNCRTDDQEVAEMNYRALKHFFEKFPEYRDREFFITGESYAGIYIPTLSVNIVEGNTDFPINFRGYAIGNGLLSYGTNENSVMFFGHYHALIGDELWNEMVHRCCKNGVEGRDTCNFFLKMSPLCEISVLKAMKIMYLSDINGYNIYKKCEHPKSETKNRYSYDLKNIGFFRNLENVQDPELYSDPPCLDSTNERIYLNNPAVREALHIPPNVPNWEDCSDKVSLLYKRRVINVASQVKFLRDHKIRGLFYSGDVDMVCNFLGTEWFIDDLDFERIKTQRTWEEGGQIAGFVTEYDGLDFLTIKGSGHMVPEDKPAEALKMFQSFIRNEPY